MANVVVLRDPDPDRRKSFSTSVLGRLQILPDLTSGRLDAGSTSVLWAAGARAPISVSRAGSAAALLVGDAWRDRTRLAARDLAEAWGPALNGQAATLPDGYHAGVLVDGDSVIVGADLLGLYPWYWACTGDVLIAASSPDVLTAHPLFEPEVEAEGLAGVLLVRGSWCGRTMLRGVRRLGPGRLLVGRGERDAVRADDVACYRMPDGQTLADLDFTDQADAVDAAFDRAVRVQLSATGGGPVGLLLSGGRDSRMLAGYARKAGTAVEALTFGLAGDHDLECARAVAGAVGASHRLQSLEATDMAGAARLHARLEQLGTSFATAHMWNALDAIRHLPDRLLTGYFMDIFFGTRAPDGSGSPFELFWSRLNRRGLHRDLVARLLGAAGGDIVTAVRDAVAAEYASLSTVPAQVPWRYQITRWERHHTGAVPWRLSFASWPVLPILDRRLLDTIAGLSSSAIAYRRVQDAILVHRFRDLARLPLDRNSANTTPLIPPASHNVCKQVLALPGAARIARLMKRLRTTAADSLRTGQPVPDRRYFFRIYDFNGAGWTGVRRAAEPYRERLGDVVDPDALRSVLPGPDTRVEFEDPITDSFGHKQLVGLLLWAGRDAGSVVW